MLYLSHIPGAPLCDFVENLWNTPQQAGTYRYYQESVYTLGLLATAGWFGYEWAPAQ